MRTIFLIKPHKDRENFGRTVRFLIQFSHLEQEKQLFALFLPDFSLSLSVRKETDKPCIH